MNKDTIDLLPCSSPPAVPLGLGWPPAAWPPAAWPPANIHEWEALMPVIQGRKLSVQLELSSDQRKSIDQQLRSNARTFDWIRHRSMPW